MATTEYFVRDSSWGVSFSTEQAAIAEQESRAGARVTASTGGEQ